MNIRGVIQLDSFLKNQDRLSSMATVVLLGMSAWVSGALIWKPMESQSVTPWQPTSVAGSASKDSGLNIAELQNSNLFGRYQAQAPVEKKPVVTEAPKSRLNVILVGVVTSTEANKNLAVVASRGQQATYGIGETLEGTRATVVQVLYDRIIVDNSGRNETVMLEGLKYTKNLQQQPKTKSIKADVSADKLDEIRSVIRKDAKQIFQYVRMSQIKRDGEVIGYRLTPGKEKELFESVGLQSGDIATQINGQDLSNPATMGEIFKNMSQLTELNLTVERDGQPYEIYIEL
ncbi:type II secretion system protein GspC [Vibrio coralliilyticus]|uniref:Type II secretion system protein GspC n=1 Tax=Vibrio coralliilyticus TaxID=190893 RepID=A0AAP6ZPR7_9VIBR|nr:MULTISPECIES: type II secretion system protein GspC [Vibrio]ARC91008.1 type II secretion system protein GspC [Vibrio coralliilyticus]ERB62683.1 general secretion pathway protein C [Vibrio coralliilyticus OCN008]MCC2524640.1 type II secretion system protein GspC [Vibrio coralliilyticus]NOI20982.1 type II secretion system protein GspC [Vibrio coralliilyticus]NOJ25879.1 type II secretion system protein GspC [Vibrio coralliilyticus]